MSDDRALEELARSSDRLREEPITSEAVFRGKLLDVRRDTVRLPGGATATREYIMHPGASMIVPMLPDGQVVLVRQYRYPMHRAFIEFPAGKIDPGEAPLATAQRELLEETGYRAGKWTELTTIHNAIAYANERIVLFLAEGLERGEQQLDEHEFLEVFTAPLEDLMAWIRQGEVTDVKTVIGAFFVSASTR
ncbi:NUDIX hydrolase [Pigmentiphaga sp.]|uniref:NUDIX domain-containing protein n=1 Tax=Pigmentiphaga sp. TaxID=1977564 RepID=UPI00128D0619|nr:NUDIX hydrolase [Pigmentiphaga sp.]MPS28486.1 NUDIX hydrolase [Alcaligenaceae bacterium SAGV5]MPS52151.1 NUDIX hydrolase [Alcaligenaceae bacterium SAGV3]MPT56307.1 NUDIX hydrolase [Alcaligenaceae bacterium]